MLKVRRKAGAARNVEAGADAEALVAHGIGSGQPMHEATRGFFESRFGHDFRDVLIHSNRDAAASAQAVNARAFTYGRNVVFGEGQYDPHSGAGMSLLAHELTHVVQQKRRSARKIRKYEARVHESVGRTGLITGGSMTNEESSAVYFGNWMRDMNQVFVPLATSLLPNDVLFALIAYMAARKFGRELTPEQFGYYIPAEHMDNPAGLVAADDLIPSQPAVSAAARPSLPARLGAARPAHLDTSQEDISPSTGSVQGVNIFAVDQTRVMAHIRRTNLHIERRLQLAADTGRNPDGMQHFGAALHAVEDLFSHTNYIEIAIDHLLRTDPAFLNQLAGADRQVFTYSARARVAGGTRPVLTSGTFTGTDTQISIASEVVGLLSRPLPDPPTHAEEEVQDRFIIALLRNFESRMRNNPQLRQTVRTALRNAGVPGPLADQADNMPLADIYMVQTYMRIPISDSIRIPMKRAIRDVISREVLQPVARQTQADALEARVADTSLINVLRESQRQQGGQFSAAQRSAMQQRERFTGVPVSQQETEARAAGGRRSQALQSTPLHVVAGPSHSQIAKDHVNSPFYGLSFLLSSIAVQRLRDRMLAAWADRLGSATTPYNFEWANFPQAAPAGSTQQTREIYEQTRHLYHDGRPNRSRQEQDSLQSGQGVLARGGEAGQSYDLAAMRQESADNVRAVAQALRAIAGAPNASASAIARVQALAGSMVPEMGQSLRRQLAQARAAATAAAGSQTVADLNSVATALEQTAAAIGTARRHAQREQTNAELIRRRGEMLDALARQPALDAGLASTLLFALDREIQETAVTYTTEQRAVVEGRQGVLQMGASPRGLSVQTIAMPAVSGSPATQALLNEARLLVAHPYENNWWEQHVRDYARRFPDRLLNDIEARNEGVPLYRSR